MRYVSLGTSRDNIAVENIVDYPMAVASLDVLKRVSTISVRNGRSFI